MLKLKLERNTYGLGTPMRKMMERKLVSEDVSMPALQQPRNLQKDVLDGVDEQITFADVHSVVDKPSTPTLDIHHEMQLKRRLYTPSIPLHSLSFVTTPSTPTSGLRTTAPLNGPA
ncbi:hypothetical protein J056_000270 [Wallemia ichthyophaga EXF-994]|uniref:Uncharacterized protein n=1 Tax=Wallemia ichthyophaga (strain EXF-994 / CBS 113033) TaxID=1299270 RepID=R9ARN8_WALI9|nr:uncharacterized protein J056_000270 [Wallemia ichthyophaga EXF-994]EOR04914.1 hypothetical protein J056_000270 [Wallemia ichthyophaga EXF-994]